jgi:hypothetical protein
MRSAKERNLLIVLLVMLAGLALVAYDVFFHDYNLPSASGGSALALSWHSPERAAAGAPVVVRFCLTSRRRAATRLAAADGPAAGFGFTVEAVNESGRGGRPLKPKAAARVKAAAVTLAPGECRAWAADLSKIFDLPPGRYRVRAVYDQAALAEAANIDMDQGGYFAEEVELAGQPVTVVIEP